VLSAWIGLVATCGYMVLGLIIVKFDRLMMRLVTVENAADRRYWSSLSDALVNILSIFALKMRTACCGWSSPGCTRCSNRSSARSSTTKRSGPPSTCSTARSG
jgi:hypothetical protein